jgi:anaerobic selenocysteine-containing dehydrogenase
VRSHDQFNTTVYSSEDRYRGVTTRQLLFLNADDMRARQIESGQPLRVKSRFGEETRTLEGLMAHAYDLPPGMAMAYFPEANPLFFLKAVAQRSGTPTSKSVCITVEAMERGR